MIKKVIIGVLALFFVTIAGLVIYSYYNKDKIIKIFIAEANKSLNTPIEVGKFDFSVLENFPHLSISLHNVSIKESSGNKNKDLGVAETMFFNFNIWQLIGGSYSIDEVSIINGNFNLREYREGDLNYRVISSPKESEGGSRIFDISSIKLRNVSVGYVREKYNQDFQFTADNLEASWKSKDKIHLIDLNGKLTLDSMIVNQIAFGSRSMDLDGSFEYNSREKAYNILPSLVNFKGSDYRLEGFLSSGNFEINVDSERADLTSLNGLLPEKDQKFISRYRSDGILLFKSLITQNDGGPISMSIDFAARNASVFYPEYAKSIKELSLEGRYSLVDINKPQQGSLKISSFNGSLEGKPASGTIEIGNFTSYPVKLQLEADLNLKDVLEFYPVPMINGSEGSLFLDIDIQGALKGDSGKPITASGQVDFKEVGFSWINSPAGFSRLNGNLIFNNEDIAISDFSGYWGESDFLLNGFLKNVLQKMAEPSTQIFVEADLNSRYINLDELLAIEQKDKKDSLFQFNLPRELGLSFKCKVDRLDIGRFKSRNNYGKLEVFDQKAKLKKVSFNVAGGKVDLDAEIDARDQDSIFVYSETAYDQIEIDSIFYIFENFNQSFLVDSHLKGQVYANIKSSLDFDRYLNLNKSSILTRTSFSIKNGELNDFEPMQQLSRYLGGQSLDHLLFSDLENQIVIENQTIFLPEMKVRSNVTNIVIRGTHTFDQKIDYYLKVPLNRNIKPDKDEAFGAIEDDGTSRAMLFLTIKGTTEDYKIAYDTRTVKKKIMEDIKKEGRELKEVFKNKGLEQEKKIELEEEEYFDFEEDTTQIENN